MDATKFGLSIKKLRENNNLTQREFAEKLGITAATVTSWERNGKFPSLDTAVRVAETFGVSLDWLCGKNTKYEKKYDTYEDIFKTLFELTQTEKIQSNIILLIEEPCDIDDKHVTVGGEITFQSPLLAEVFSSWISVKKLYDKGTIDKNLYLAWMERECRILKDMPLKSPMNEYDCGLIEQYKKALVGVDIP